MATTGLAISGRGALAQSAKLEVIARNLAHALTVGYRRETIGFRANLEAAIGLDRRPGDLDVTRRPFDLAILGPGYFTVRDLETGADYFTRAGNFNLDSSGRLVTADGRCQAVASDGRAIALDPAAAGGFRVAEDGTLFSGDVEYGQLGVVEFEDVARLARRGDNLVENRGSALGGASGSRIQQGTLERSSVDPALEQADMTRALRALEANLQMIRIMDATLERTVNEFARPLK
jgi:flagellar basal body rod protein FlgG